mgnify:CR=1 FL=1
MRDVGIFHQNIAARPPLTPPRRPRLRAPPWPALPGVVPGGRPGVVRAFRWENAETDKPYWIPQGITGLADAQASGVVAGRHVVVLRVAERARTTEGLSRLMLETPAGRVPLSAFATVVERIFL